MGTLLIKVNSTNFKKVHQQWLSNMHYHYKFLDKDKIVALHDYDVKI